MALPDIPVDLWLQDQQDLFRSSADQMVDALGFRRDAAEQINSVPPDAGGMGWEGIEEQQRQEAARVKEEADAAEARAAEAAQQAAAQELQRQLEAQRQEALDYGQRNNQNGSSPADQGANPQVPSGGAGDLPGYGDDARAFSEGADKLFEQHFGEPPSEADQFRAQANGLIEQQFGRDAIDSIVKEDPKIRNWGQEGVPNQPPANPLINADSTGEPSTTQDTVRTRPSLVQQNDPAKGLWGGADTGQSMADGSIPEGPVDYRRDWDSRRSGMQDYSGMRQIEDARQALGPTAEWPLAGERAGQRGPDYNVDSLDFDPSSSPLDRYPNDPGLDDALRRPTIDKPNSHGESGVVDAGRQIETEDQAFGRNQGLVQPLPDVNDDPFNPIRFNRQLPRPRSAMADAQPLSGTSETPTYDPSTEGATPSSYDRPQTGEEVIPPQVPTGPGSPYDAPLTGEQYHAEDTTGRTIPEMIQDVTVGDQPGRDESLRRYGAIPGAVADAARHSADRAIENAGAARDRYQEGDYVSAIGDAALAAVDVAGMPFDAAKATIDTAYPDAKMETPWGTLTLGDVVTNVTLPRDALHIAQSVPGAARATGRALEGAAGRAGEALEAGATRLPAEVASATTEPFRGPRGADGEAITGEVVESTGQQAARTLAPPRMTEYGPARLAMESDLPPDPGRRLLQVDFTIGRADEERLASLTGRDFSGHTKWDSVFGELEQTYGAEGAQQVLERLGYDGVKYEVGSRHTQDWDNQVLIFDRSSPRQPSAPRDASNLGLDDIQVGPAGAGGGDVPPRGPTDLALPEPPPRPDPPTGDQFTATPAGEDALGRLDRMIKQPRMENPQPEVTGSAMTEVRRQLTDDRARAQDIQNAVQKLSDQPLPIEARMVEMSRLNGAGVGEQYLKELLPPILQRLGRDAPEASKYLALRNNLDIAADMVRQHGPEAAAARRFSGDLTAAESEGALGALAKRLGPERMGKIEREAQEIYKVNQVARQMLVDSEVYTPAAVADWAERYPHWVKTQIVDYAGSGAPGTRNGATISLSSDGVRPYTVEGTIKDRADPLLSTAQNLLQASSMAAKNRTFVALAALREQSPEFQQLFRQVRGVEAGKIGPGAPGIARTNETALAVKGADRFLSEGYTPKADEVAITGFLKGVKTTFIGPKSMDAVVTMSGATPIPIWSMLFGLSKELATSRNPGFVLTMAPLRDLASYGVRATSREGGPTPRVLADVVASYVRGVGDAFQGITQGRVTGPMSSRALREGGGMSGMYMEQKAPTIANTDLESVAGRGRRALAWVQGKNVDPGKALLEELSRPNVYTIKSAADIRRIAFQTLTGGPVKAFAERMELAPRTAQLGLTERRLTKAGASAAEATFQGVQDFRTVTIDFNVGGELSKKINMGLQFFNVGMQAMVTPWRAFREHPKAFTATVATLIGGPAIEAELWNRADPERAQDYDDVPAYVKDIGIVWMAPKTVGGIPIPAFRGTDIKGNPRPNYFFMPLGEFAPFAVLAREAAGRILGAEGRGPRDLTQGVATSLLPVQGAVPLPPVASTGIQLGADYDFFRNRKIATKQMDQDASVGSQAIANTINRTFGKDLRPSQVEFALRDIGRAGANVVLGATDIAGGKTKNEDRIQNTPVVGGILRRVLGDQIGGQLQHAQQNALNDTTLKMLQDNGIAWRPSLVDNNISGMPITLSEQAKVERETMTNFNRQAVAVSRTPAWEKASVAARQAELQRLYTVYHADAERVVAAKIPKAEIDRRLATAKGK